MIFNSSYNPSDWATESTVKTEFDNTALSHTCPAGGVASTAHTFKAPLLDDELAKLSHKNFSPNTIKQICWVRRMYQDWRAHRHSCGLEFIVCDLEEKATITAESLKFALCHFITQVKKVNGEDFPGKTLYHIIVYI